MILPQNFQFSQGSLQDFADCPRRFQLKYIQQLAWPAVQAEPVEENETYLQLGASFHRLVQQYFMGIPAEKLTLQTAQNIQLERWWENFLASTQDSDVLQNLANRKHYPEISLSTPFEEYRLTGKYDLLAIEPENDAQAFKATIYDWKTSRKHPKREWVAQNLQTRVYPYLLAKAGAAFNTGVDIPPEQIEMVYWFANFPTAPLRFPYSQAQLREDEAHIHDLIAALKTLEETPAPLTDNEKRCRFCVYRSLCNRGVMAGPMAEFEDEAARDDFNFELDFEQIAEIEF